MSFIEDVSPWWMEWNPDNVTISDTTVDDTWKTCVLQGVYYGGNDYSGNLGARISSVFVILVVSTWFTLFPIVAKKIKWLKIHKYAYQIARNFGTGVIIATAFIHLLDPAYAEIGGWSCVGLTGNWAIYSWCPAIMLVTVFITFLVDLFSNVYVQKKYGIIHQHNADEIEETIVRQEPHVHDTEMHEHGHSTVATNNRNTEDKSLNNYQTELHEQGNSSEPTSNLPTTEDKSLNNYQTDSDVDSIEAEYSFRSEFGAFLILEFGVLFHSVMIGLNLGSVGKEFSTLYPVLVFHQSFEGLGIGARLSVIEFPYSKRWWPYVLCLAYGMTTPVCVAIGLGVRNTYDGNSYTVNVVSGVLDAISAGVLLYTGLVELLARDYLFNPKRTNNVKELIFNVISMLWGAGLMALLGKWA